jgi:hypothetical protein
VRNLIELFGPIGGEVSIDTCIEAVTLPAFKARALVLLSYELVVNTLVHNLCVSGGRSISVTLSRDRSYARLAVSDSSRGFFRLGLNPCSTTNDLAALLEAKTDCCSSPGGGVLVKAQFPL